MDNEKQINELMRNWKKVLMSEGARPGEVSVEDFIAAVVLSINDAFQELRPNQEVVVGAYEQISRSLDQIFRESYQDVQRLAGHLGASGGFEDWDLDDTLEPSPSKDTSLIKPYGRYKTHNSDSSMGSSGHDS